MADIMKGMYIRSYEPSDQKQIVNLHMLALGKADVYRKIEWEKDLENVKEYYVDKYGDFLVGVVDNKIVAMGAIRKLTGDTAELKRMRIHPDYQRQGLGQMILDRLEERARELGYTTIQLDTPDKQVAAQKFYEKNGYKEIRRETERWPFELIYYQKELA